MKKRSLIIILCAALLVTCGGKKGKVALQEVEVAKVELGAIKRTVLFTGNIDAQDAVQVFPRADGKVSKKLLKEGDYVKKGQAILVVDRDEIGYKFKPMPVDSPIDGLVGSILVDVGSNVNPQTAVITVVKSGDMRVKLDVPERYLDVILPGTKVSMIVDTLNGEKFEGEIITSSPVVNEKTRTARVEINVPDPEKKLRHGMFGRLNLVVEQHDGVLVAPYNSISWEGEKQFVYKVLDDKIGRKEIKVGMRNDTHVEVLEGLEEGDSLVVGSLLDLKDGAKVKIK